MNMMDGTTSFFVMGLWMVKNDGAPRDDCENSYGLDHETPIPYVWHQ